MNTQLEKIEKKEAILLLVYGNNQLVGVSGVDMKDKIDSHVGVFGISIAKEFRGEGIGKILMTKVLEEAVKNIPQLKIVTLGVFSNNPLAIEMYKKFGFIEYGSLPEGVLHKGKYVDHVYMYKKVR